MSKQDFNLAENEKSELETNLNRLRLNVLIENLHGGVLVENEKRQILHVNKFFCEIFSIPLQPHQMLGWDCSQAAEQSKNLFKNPEQFMQQVDTILKAKEKVIDDILEMNDGRVLERDYVPIFFDEMYRGHMWIYRDITDRVLKEKQLQEQQLKVIAASKMASIGEVAAGIAHEINNPLSIIQGSASIIRSIITKETYDVSAILSRVETIDRTCKRIAKTIRGLRILSRDGGDMQVGDVPLKSMIEDALMMFSEKMRAKGIELRQMTEIDTTLFCNEIQITQILINLLSNSIDAVSLLDKKWISIETKIMDSKVLISVSDSGSGIPIQIQQKLGQPFFTTKEIGGGTGLGLSISMKMARVNGGVLYYDSTSENTRFILELPNRPN